MIRFILVALSVILFLIFSIPILIVEWLLGKANPDRKSRQSLAIVQFMFRFLLRLSGVTWQGQGGTGANGSLIPTSYTATASYSGTGSTRYATGYLTTADYSGVVTKDEIEKVIYTVSYSGSPIEKPEPEQDPLPIWLPLCGVGALAAGVGITLVVIKIRKRRKMPL